MTDNEWAEVFIAAVPIGRWRSEGNLVIVQSRAVPDVEQMVGHGGAPEEAARDLVCEMALWPQVRRGTVTEDQLRRVTPARCEGALRRARSRHGCRGGGPRGGEPDRRRVFGRALHAR